MSPLVADSVGELTPAYLSGALGVQVAGVDATRIGTGQMGATYQLALTYGGGVDAGPATLVAKLAAENEAMRGLVAQGYRAEVGFYRELAPALAVRTPRCWYAAMADDGPTFTLLLDDIDGAEVGVQADGCSVDRARSAVANLVGLHAPRWGDPALAGLDFLMLPNAEVAELMQAGLEGATPGFCERYAGELDDEIPALLHDVSHAIAAWQTSRVEPSTVVHGDYRLDNLLFSPGDDVVAVDWQTAALGPALRDVAYFLGTSLDTERRRAEEERLVASYHDGLVAAGVEGYDADRCWTDYRFGHLQGPMITILGCMYATGERSERSDAMFLAMIRRSCAAIRDLGTLDLL